MPAGVEPDAPDDVAVDGESAWEYTEADAPRVEPLAASRIRIAPTPELLKFNSTDSGNAERLVMLHGESLRYVPTWGKWLAWNGSRWVADARGGPVYRAAKKMVREFQTQAIGHDPKVLRFAAGAESKRSLDAMVALAAHERKVLAQHEDFDRDPDLINVRNGTIDLRTGNLRPHQREDLCTKMAPVAFDPKAECPRFDQFLSEVMAGDADLAAFVVSFLGYCLTGHTREHVLAFWHGPGGNGKGVLGAVVLHIMGDYAGKAAPDLLFRGEKTERHPAEVAELHGKRLVICNETSRSRAWDEATVKDVTGGDRLTARRMREDFWSWDPTHKLIVWGNHKPPIRNVDDGIRRRLRLVPFAVSFKGREDRSLLPALLAEAPGILRRLVDGCVAWYRTGLPDASAVRVATDGYLRDEDTLGRFLDAALVFAPNVRCTRKDVTDRYLAWAEDLGEKPVSPKTLADALREKGAQDKRVKKAGKSCAGWAGVTLAAPDLPDDEPEQIELHKLDPR